MFALDSQHRQPFSDFETVPLASPQNPANGWDLARAGRLGLDSRQLTVDHQVESEIQFTLKRFEALERNRYDLHAQESGGHPIGCTSLTEAYSNFSIIRIRKKYFWRVRPDTGRP